MQPIRRLCLLALVAASVCGYGQALAQSRQEPDHDRARDALEEGEARPLREIIPLAFRAVPGEIVEIELERKHGRLVYEIEILGRDGRVQEVTLDARTGAVLSVEDDD